MPERPASMVFQYQKGAIKTIVSKNRLLQERGFQYQKGAIKTVWWPAARTTESEFQYQKGAIKTTSIHSFCTAIRRISIPKRCD